MIILVLPTILIIISAIFLYWNYRYSENWRKLIAALSALLSAFGLLACSVLFADAGLVGFISALPASLAAMISGVVLFLSGKRMAKLIGVIFSLIVPFAMITGVIWMNEKFSESAIIPHYVDEIKTPTTIWGWLYQSTRENFALGYVSYVDKFGYGVCILTRTNRNWKCLYDSPELFDLDPTPYP